jgi:hypothetical protein
MMMDHPCTCIGIPEDDPDLASRLKPHLGDALGSRLNLMGQASLFNLATGISAMHIGVPGQLIIEMPSRAGDRIEIDWQPTSRTRSS